MKAIFIFGLIAMLIAVLTGCNNSRPIPCTKPAIQMADMSSSYQHCKGLDYE